MYDHSSRYVYYVTGTNVPTSDVNKVFDFSTWVNLHNGGASKITKWTTSFNLQYPSSHSESRWNSNKSNFPEVGTLNQTVTYNNLSEDIKSTNLYNSLYPPSSYTIPSDQSLVDKFIRVQVVTTDSRGGTTTFHSAAQQVVNVDDAAVGDVTITGTVEEGATVSADVSGITDADDDDGVLAFTYQWQSSSNDTTFANIDGASSSTYSIPSDQTLVDKYLRVQVTSTDSRGGTIHKSISFKSSCQCRR